MARTNNLSNFLTDVASAIKEKKGDSTNIPASSFDTEILSLPSQGVYQTKQVNISTNGNYIITPDNGYDAIEEIDLSVEAGEDLTQVLNTQDQKIAELEEALENKTAGPVKLNLYVQTTEPDNKNGIWLQSDKTFDKVCVDTDIIADEEWLPANSYGEIPSSVFSSGFTNGACVAKDNDIYLFSTNITCKFNIKTKTFTKLTNAPYSLVYPIYCIVGDDVYLFSTQSDSTNYKRAYKYNITSGSYTRLADIPYNCYTGVGAVINDNIYLFGGASTTTAYKYNITDNSYTRLATVPLDISFGDAIAVNSDIYILGCLTSSKRQAVYKYDTKLNKYTRLTDIPHDFTSGKAIKLNNNEILLFGGKVNASPTRYWYKYNIESNDYIEYNNIPMVFSNGGAAKIGDEQIFLFGGQGQTKTIQAMNLLVKEYEDDSILISQGVGDYSTKLQNADTIGTLNYYFHDVWYYTREDGLDKTIPTYYGNGTEWVKFKN